MRCFVAIRIPQAVRSLLVRVQEALGRAGADVKWVEEENLHLSLKFLGELSEDGVGRLSALLSAEALRWPRLRLAYAGVGAFPERGAPRVVWAGCSGDLEKAAGLAAALERAAEQVGVPRENRLFVAHVTLGRVKSTRRLRPLAAAIENQREAAFGSEEAGEFVLYRSTLTPEGPIYEEVASFAMGG